MKHWWNDYWKVKVEVLGKRCPCHFVHYKSHMTCPSIEHNLCNHLRCGAASFIKCAVIIDMDV
jgi:hypothetical protein